MPISDKQRKILAFPFTDYDALIADGAIRSGKTSFMSLAFIDDAMRRYKNQRFGICGKTVDSTIKNIITPYLALGHAKERYNLQWRKADKTLTVSNGKWENVFEVFGGKDESSFALIQGRTLAGILVDEVALQPRSFVEQAIARCSVDGAKLWFNCNPDSPAHWFYKEWILKAKEKNALHLHFNLEDNPALSERIIKRYMSLYTGVFFRRYILGEWVKAEGLVFSYDEERNGFSEEPEGVGSWYMSCDYGIINPFVCQLWHIIGKTAYCVDEYYYNSKEHGRQRTDEEHYAEIEKLAGDRPIDGIIIDPSASSMKETIYRHERFDCFNANNDVVGGIGHMASLMQAGMLKYNTQKCSNTIAEFGLYSWDEDSGADKPIKENDHGCDASRYFVSTILVDEFDWINWGERQ